MFSYGLTKKWLLLELAIKMFTWNHKNALVILFRKNFIKILITNIGNDVISITGKISLVVHKQQVCNEYDK